MRGRRGWDRRYENQSTPLQSQPDGARHVSVQIAAKIAKIHRIRLRGDCTREFNASVATVHLSTKSQIACRLLLDSERRLLTRIRYLSQFAEALASFGAGEILQGSECRRLDRRAPQLVPGTRPDSVW